MDKLTSAREVERCLVLLYTDANFLHEFLAAPTASLQRFSLSAADHASLLAMDFGNLKTAARHFTERRDQRQRKPKAHRQSFRFTRWPRISGWLKDHL